MRFAEIVGPGRAEARSGADEKIAVAGPAAVGDWVGLNADGTVGEVLARSGSAKASLYAVAAELGLDPYFSAAVLEETAQHLAAKVEGLEDLTHQPFVTIDGPHSRDLDQALLVEPVRDGEYLLHYALADAAHYAVRGSALFQQAMARGASFYFPGFAIPMLPRPLSEDLVSLNPGVNRRALVYRVLLDHRGEVLLTSVARGIIRSRKKLAWGDVTRFYAGGPSPITGTDHERSLRLLAELGEVLLDREASRDLIRFHREEIDVSLDDEGCSFVVTRAVRDRVELYNEQISLLVNGEGARMLREHPSPDVEPIYRIHPAPDTERLEGLHASIEAIARRHHLPEGFVWKRGSSLARYIAALPAPTLGALDETARVARALERQAIVANLRSYYAVDPGPHYGVGLDPYGRFTAPMREIVGVFLHGETIEAFGLGKAGAPRDPTLREAVVEAGNRSRDVQRQISDAGNRLTIDRLLRADLALPKDARPRRKATVMGIAGSKVHVSLDDPPLDLKLYLKELGQVLGGVWLKASEDGVALREEKSGREIFAVGDAIELRTMGLDGGSDRWILEPTKVPA